MRWILSGETPRRRPATESGDNLEASVGSARATTKAQQFYVSAGQHLKTLKAMTPNWREWEIVLLEKVGIGKFRASELMAIADGERPSQKRARKP